MYYLLRNYWTQMVLLLFICPILSAQTVRNVGSGQTYSTVSAAISAAASGDTINIVDPVITENSLSIYKNLVIRGQGANNTILQAQASAGVGNARIIFISSGYTVKIFDLHLRYGNLNNHGGAISTWGTTTIERCRFSYNRVTGDGGAVMVTNSAITIKDCTFDNNQAGASGLCRGGVIFFNGTTCDFENCTMYGNSASYGGAIYKYSGTLNITNCTIAGNTGNTNGGALYGVINGMKNTILSDNLPNNCVATVTSGGYNIDDGSSCACTATGDLQNTDPMLLSLTDNGGSTPTMGLESGSPAIDPASSNGAPSKDQRGTSRQNNADIGAFEFIGMLPVQLSSFSAQVRNDNVFLQWNTASETDNHGFEIQRNTGNKWENIGFIFGAGTTSAPRFYAYTDPIPRNAERVNYRLKQIDRNGSFEYSKEIVLQMKNAGLRSPELTSIYPNPFNPLAAISYSLPAESPVTLVVYDMKGKPVCTLVDQSQMPGTHTIEFDGSDLPSGNYLVKLTAGSTSTTKQMVLSK